MSRHNNPFKRIASFVERFTFGGTHKVTLLYTPEELHTLIHLIRGREDLIPTIVAYVRTNKQTVDRMTLDDIRGCHKGMQEWRDLQVVKKILES